MSSKWKVALRYGEYIVVDQEPMSVCGPFGECDEYVMVDVEEDRAYLEKVIRNAKAILAWDLTPWKRAEEENRLEGATKSLANLDVVAYRVWMWNGEDGA